MSGTGAPEAAPWVRRMFGSVAHRYDLLNHLLSFGLDRSWRRRTVARVEPVLLRPGARVLDLCCGTGDLLMALQARRDAAVYYSSAESLQPAAILGRGAGRQACNVGGLADRIRRQDCRRGGQDCPLHGSGCGCAAVWGCDFSGPMLDIARRKISAPVLIEADALHLPMPDGSLDLITIAFGFRNLTSYRAGLQEMARVLRPGGVAAILEFSQPRGRVFPALYGFYSRHVLPLVGGILSGSRDAYAYLPESVRRFPGAEDLAAEMRAAGFGEVTYERMTAGVVALHLGTR